MSGCAPNRGGHRDLLQSLAVGGCRKWVWSELAGGRAHVFDHLEGMRMCPAHRPENDRYETSWSNRLGEHAQDLLPGSASHIDLGQGASLPVE
jgi:hypothetical protein